MPSGKASLNVSEWIVFLRAQRGAIRNGAKVLKAAFNTAGFSDIIDHFKKQEGPEGKWKPRASSTQLRYALISSGQWRPPRGMRRGSFSPSNKILQLTGNLRKSLLPSNVKRVNASSILFYANAKYSGAHDRGEGNLPERSFMWLSDRGEERMRKAILELIAVE